ncbi:MAG TPA: universal stress protein [Acidimicrobiales bacterium]
MNEFVVGVDGSDHSRRALRWAAAAAEAAGVPARAVQSWALTHEVAEPLGSIAFEPDEMDERVQRALAGAVAETLGSPSAVATEVLRGQPAGALLGATTPDSVLVLGARGLGGFRGLLLGSVSQECVEYASCPVVVVRTDRAFAPGNGGAGALAAGRGADAPDAPDAPGDEAGGDPADGGDVFLVGKDGSEGAQRALAWAQALADRTGAQVRAVHAWRAVASERPPGKTERLRSRAADAVRGWTEDAGADVESEEVEGDPRRVLVQAAERHGSALTVVGRRGAGGLRSMRLGSTANHLVRHAPSNVAVVPEG